MSHMIAPMEGRRFGELTVVCFAGTAKGNAFWVCRCSCGAGVIARGDWLRSGKRKLCDRSRHAELNPASVRGQRRWLRKARAELTQRIKAIFGDNVSEAVRCVEPGDRRRLRDAMEGTHQLYPGPLRRIAARLDEIEKTRKAVKKGD